MKIFLRIMSVILAVMGMMLCLTVPVEGIIAIVVAVYLWITSSRQQTKPEPKQEAHVPAPTIDTSHVRDDPIVLDLETTGLDCFDNEILSCAIIDKHGKVLFDQMFKPVHRERWPAAEKVNHISPKDVAHCSTFAEARDEIQQIIDTHTAIVGYNVEFDLRFLEANGIRHTCPSVDVMARYGYMRERNASRRYKLTTAARQLGYEWHGDAHTALADTQATLYVYRKTLEAEGLSL